MGDSHHFHHHHHHPRPKSQVFCDDDDDDIEFPERSSSSTGLIRHSETHHSVQSQSQKSELEQLRSRVCQMEKTMRWWSDCTSNWKQKWSQVRQERNALRAQLKEITGGSVAPKPEMKPVAVQTDRCGDENDVHHQMMMNNNAQSISTAADVHLLTKLLDEAQRTITIEREEKLHLHRSIERLQQDLVEFHTMYDELVKEVQLLKLDENSKVSEVDQQEEEQQVVGGEELEDAHSHQPHQLHVATAAIDISASSLEEPEHRDCHLNVMELELVETGVDGDDEEDEEDADALLGLDLDVGEKKRDEVKDDRCDHRQEEKGCNEEKRVLVTMSNSKSQQISSKHVITNDADHHTSL